MMDCLNKLDLSDQNYQTNEIVRDQSYKGKFLFTMKDFVFFRIDYQSMYFLTTRLLKDNINGVHVPQFQLAYIHDTTHFSYTNLVNLCSEVHYMW